MEIYYYTKRKLKDGSHHKTITKDYRGTYFIGLNSDKIGLLFLNENININMRVEGTIEEMKKIANEIISLCEKHSN